MPRTSESYEHVRESTFEPLQSVSVLGCQLPLCQQPSSEVLPREQLRPVSSPLLWRLAQHETSSTQHKLVILNQGLCSCELQYARRWRLAQEPTSSQAPLRQSNAIRCPITGQSPAVSERRGTGHRPARPADAPQADAAPAARDSDRRDGAAARRPG